jgi:hypothetical protein
MFSVLLALSAIGRVVLFYRRPELVSRLDLVEAGFGLICIPALLGFLYQRAYVIPIFWQGICVVVILLSFYQFFTPKMQKLYQKGFLISALTIILQMILGGPGLWALVQYAFLDGRLWK